MESKKIPISEFLEKEIIQMECKTGKRMSDLDFAKYLGLPQSTYSEIKKGKYHPRGKTLSKLINKFGIRFFREVEGYEEPTSADLLSIFPSLPKEWAQDFLDAYFEYNEELERRGIKKDSPEARKIIMDALSKRSSLKDKLIPS